MSAQCADVRAKIAFSIIHIEPVLVVSRADLKFIAATHHVQVLISVPVRIEKQRTHILFVFLTSYQFLRAETLLLVLHINTSRLIECPAYVKIVEPVAIHVTYRNARAVLG